MLRWLFVGLMIGFPSVLSAQWKDVREGNRLYQDKKYKEAAAAYEQGLKENPGNIPGIFNLGNALFQQKNYDASRKVLDAAAKNAPDKLVKGDANYNIGNTYMQEQKWEDAIDAYKKTLRNNPGDEAAKYNLSYAREMMKKQENKGGGKDKNKDQQNKDQKDKKDEQNKDQQDKKDQQDQQNKNDENKKEEQQKKPQPQPSKLSKEQADQLLNALAQEEKKLHDKKEKGKATQAKLDKDW